MRSHEAKGTKGKVYDVKQTCVIVNLTVGRVGCLVLMINLKIFNNLGGGLWECLRRKWKKNLRHGNVQKQFCCPKWRRCSPGVCGILWCTDDSPQQRTVDPKFVCCWSWGTSSKHKGTRVKSCHLECVSESKRRLNVSKSHLMTQQIWLVTSS